MTVIYQNRLKYSNKELAFTNKADLTMLPSTTLFEKALN